jgi:hypothetical protein
MDRRDWRPGGGIAIIEEFEGGRVFWLVFFQPNSHPSCGL